MSHTRIAIRLSLILLIVQSASCLWKPNNPKRELVCYTPECNMRGQEYTMNMDIRADPCQDFYTFTCGNWLKHHPGPKYAAQWNLLHVMNVDFLKILREALESYVHQPDEDILFRNAKEVYETCVKIPEYPKKEASDIAREITKIGRVPNTPLWEIHSKYLKLSGESALFQFKVLSGHTSKSLPVLIVMEPIGAYGIIEHEGTWKPQEKKAYRDFLFLIMKSLHVKESDAVIKANIQKVFDFREDFERIIDRNTKKNPGAFHLFTGRELNKWFSDNLGTKTKTQDIPWMEVVNALLQHLPQETRENQKILCMRQKQYFLDLLALLKTVPEDVLAYHMEIYFVERHLKLSDNMYKLLEATSTEPKTLLQYIREIYYPRWQICLENHNMQETLEKLIYQRWPKEGLQIVHQLNGNIKKAIKNQMRQCPWLDARTREDTWNKLDDLEEWFGFPPWINGEGWPKGRIIEEILTPEALLDIPSNSLYVHAPLLIPPLFSPTIPAVYNYAGIGSTLGHEMYHVINDCGAFTYHRGTVNWWPQEIRNKCLENKLFFVKAFNDVTDRDYKNRYNVDVQSNTTSKVLENYPDVMGLEAAYNAYKELLKTDESACRTLPHFEQYSCDQMFYIAFGNTFCGHYTAESAEDKLYTWVHSLDSIRINGAAAQMKNFGTTFGCPVGSPMNPKEKANLWK